MPDQPATVVRQSMSEQPAVSALVMHACDSVATVLGAVLGWHADERTQALVGHVCSVNCVRHNVLSTDGATEQVAVAQARDSCDDRAANRSTC